MSIDFVAYHDRTGDDHQIQFNTLYNAGYRMISLSVYNPEAPLYAAVWVKRAGPPWAAIHGASADTWQIFFNQWAAQGFHPIILTAAGPVNRAVFAAVVEQRPGPVPLTRHHLISGPDTDPNSIQYWNKQAHTNGWRLAWAASYGDALQPRFAGIWPANQNGVVWNTDGISDSSADYQRRFDAQVSAWARPAFVTLSGTQRYLSVFTDDQIGEWVARHNMTSSGYQTEFDTWVGRGFYPIRVQAAGSGSNTRFAAIFAKQEEPIARQWSMTGSPAVPAIDQAMQSTMQTYRVRGAALAVLKGTRLHLGRARLSDQSADDSFPRGQLQQNHHRHRHPSTDFPGKTQSYRYPTKCFKSDQPQRIGPRRSTLCHHHDSELARAKQRIGAGVFR